MVWIKTIDQKEAKGELQKIYEQLVKKRGKVANVLKIQSLLPKTMHDHMQLYTHIMFNKSSIPREDKELIAVVVSKINNCPYCINHHAEALNYYWKDKEKIDEFLQNLDYSTFSEKKQAVLTYAEKLTKHPNNMKESDINNLKENGLNDKEILEIALIISYFNFVNRMALGLNVEFTEEEMKGYKY
ncbi:MAG: peroxidase-related enzyme [Candidatus Thermoplasmatota archaeon]|nr:peroxidase-related enzyme [Candidatus Thermoplasmatota archaeon]